MPDTVKASKSEAPNAEEAQGDAKPAEPAGSPNREAFAADAANSDGIARAPQPGNPPMPNPDSITRLHETLPEGLPRPSTEPKGLAKSQGDLRGTPGTLPDDPTQATDPSAAKPGTPGVD